MSSIFSGTPCMTLHIDSLGNSENRILNIGNGPKLIYIAEHYRPRHTPQRAVNFHSNGHQAPRGGGYSNLFLHT